VLYQLSYSHRFVTDYSNWGESCQTGHLVLWGGEKCLTAAHADVLESHGAQTR
jgi:hypothetical protein